MVIDPRLCTLNFNQFKFAPYSAHATTIKSPYTLKPLMPACPAGRPPPDLESVNMMAPPKLMMIPTTVYPVKRCLKSNAPKIIVHSGDSVFNIPASELSNLVCAQANRKAGMKIPIKPDTNNLK